jgi:hypothetical protein
MTTKDAALITIVALIGSLGGARAQALVSVEYRIEAGAFKATRTDDLLTFTLFSDAACSAQVGEVVVPAGDPGIRIEKPKLVRVKGAAKLPKTLSLSSTLELVVASPFFLEVTGNGIVGAKASCQAQLSGGAQGPQGDPGPPGQGATALWAAVGSDGVLARGSGVASSLRGGVGQYGVIFDRDVTGCAYVASGSTIIAGPPPTRIVNVSPRTGDANGVFVRIDDAAGALTDSDFYLAVFCP